MLAILSQVANSASSDPLNPLYGLGIGGVFIVLVLIGLLWPKPSVEQILRDRDSWKLAYEIERDAHMALQRDRQAQIERDELTNKMLEEIRASAGSLKR